MKIIKLSAGDIDLKRERERNHKYAVYGMKRGITTDPTATKKTTNK